MKIFLIVFSFCFLLSCQILSFSKIQSFQRDISSSSASEDLSDLTRLARKKDAQAQYDLALIHYKAGKEDASKRKLDAAVYWLQRSARGGHSKAQMMLADMYAKGEGVEKKLVNAYIWYFIALSYGREKAKEKMKIVKKGMSALEFSIAKKDAVVFLERVQMMEQKLKAKDRGVFKKNAYEGDLK